jgi:hypothetical protein
MSNTSQYEVYEIDDCVLPVLNLPTPCEIRVELHEDKIKLVVGPRDWEWSRTTGQLDNAGTMLGENA